MTGNPGSMDSVRIHPSRTTGAACTAVVLLAASAFLAWRFGTPALGHAPVLRPLSASGAAGALLAACALWLLRDPRRSRPAGIAAAVLALAAFAIGASALWQLLAGFEPVIERLLSGRPPSAPDNTMAHGDPLSLVVTGTGLLFLWRRRALPAQWCALAVLVVAAVAVQAWVYVGLAISRQPPPAYLPGPISIVTFVLLAVGLLAARPREGITAVLIADRPGGLMSRRLWLPLLLLTMAMGAFLEWMEVKAPLEPRLDSVFLVVWVSLLSSFLVWRNARALNRLDEELRRMIDERANAERLLRRQASLFDQSYEAMVISRWEGPIAFWNRGAAHLYGFSREQAMGQVAHELLRTQVAGGIPALFEHLHRNRYWEGELRQRHRNGREVIVDTRMTVVDDEDGTFVVAATRDITERVRAEGALRSSERRFRDIAEWLPQLVWTCQPDGWCDFLSQRWLDYTGASIEQEVGYGWLQRVHPDDQARLMESWQQSVATASEFAIEFRIRRHDGVYRWFDTRALPLRDESGHVVKWFGSNTDIHDQRAIREQLRANEERLALALDITGTAAWDLDLTTGELRRTIDHDRIFGYETLQADWTFDRFLGHVVAEDRERIRRRFERTMTAAQDDWGFDCRIRRTDGELRWIAVRGRSRRNATGDIVLLSGVVQDITARKEIEEEITRLNADLEWRVEQRTQELAAANRELEAFSYSVSHDLRAPLRTLDGFSQAVLEDFGPELPAEGQRYLRIIREGAQKMGRLIDDLLAFSRLSRQPLNTAPVDMRALACEAWREVLGPAPPSGVEVTVDSLPPASGDPSLLRQVWLNLLSNALKYSRNRSPARVHIGAIPAQGVYFVRDNGTGFDMQYAHKLFGVFQRLHRSEDFEGTGVGLAVVQRIVHRHGGEIWAEAAVDKGATFYFTLGAGRPSS